MAGPESNEELERRLQNLDDGFCNPIKQKIAAEDAEDIREQLRERGYDEAEIRELERED